MNRRKQLTNQLDAWDSYLELAVKLHNNNKISDKFFEAFKTVRSENIKEILNELSPETEVPRYANETL